MRARPEQRAIDVGWVSAVMTRLIATGKPVMVLDQTTNDPVPIAPEIVGGVDGFLPLLLAVGDTVWHEATGRSLGLDLPRDPKTMLGYRVRGIAPGPVAPVLLSTMHAMAEAARPDMLLLNDLHGPWMAAQDRMRWVPDQTAIRVAPAPVSPAPAAIEPIRSNSRGMRP